MKKNTSKIIIAVCLGLLTIIIGEICGITFGIYEDNIKTKFVESAKKNQTNFLNFGDKEKSPEEIADKGLKYITRGHIHAMGLGVISIAAILVLWLSILTINTKIIFSLGISLGGLGYPLLLTLCGIMIPFYGIEGAKSLLEIPVMLAIGIHIFSLVGITNLLIYNYLIKSPAPTKKS